MTQRPFVAGGVLALAALFAVVGCEEPPPPTGSYYEARIQPVFGGCVENAGVCHVANDRGEAPGNLDISTYDALMRRADVLEHYGPYPVPTLLLKAGDPVTIHVATLDPPDPSRPDVREVAVRTNITHGGGRTIATGSDTDAMLRQWISNGYTRTGVPRVARTIGLSGTCSDVAGSGPALASLSATDRASYDRYVSEVSPILNRSCGDSSCHGSPVIDFHLACGDTEEQLLGNWASALDFLGDPFDRSELLRRPLPPNRGGTFHAGGAIFSGTGDSDWQTVSAWAEATVAADPDRFRADDSDPGFRYFANRVQPVLVRDGCMVLGCHSPLGVRFQLRGGSGGAFSMAARRHNHKLALSFLALASEDASRSRIIAKNSLEPEGIPHRGGSLFAATPGLDCSTFDLEHGNLDEIPSRCILTRWHELERADAIARGELPAAPDPRAIVWVDRPLGVGTTLEYDTYRPGADLRIADVTLDAEGHVSLGTSRSLLAGCGLDASTADVRRPASAWDGNRIAFAARSSASAPLRLYWAQSDGSGCERIPGVAPSADEANGMLLHDFDPAFAPDGTILFASTRGDVAYGHPERGPTRTASRLLPNANLYVFDPAARSTRQLTWLLNAELQPAFMGDGHAIYSVEKRARDFYQISLRRHLLDGGDYHPLYGQRDTVGFESATEVAELGDGRFVFIGADLDSPDGAGSVVLADRSLGPDQDDRDPNDVRYFASRDILLAGPGRGSGAYRSASPLPTGRILVSCDMRGAPSAPYDFDLCELEPRDGSLRVIQASPGRALIEAVAVAARPVRGIQRSDGAEIDHPLFEEGADDAIVRFTDFPMIESLMFRNIRTSRPIDDRIGGLEVLESFPPPSGVTRMEELPGDRLVTDAFGTYYEELRSIGSVQLFHDGSTRIRVPAGRPLVYAPLGMDGEPLEFAPGMPFTGRLMQRETEQYSPGERISRSVPRRFFNSLCGGCHGSITGRELDVTPALDVLTGASIDIARTAEPHDLTH